MVFSAAPVFRPNVKPDSKTRFKKKSLVCLGIIGFGGAFLVGLGAVLLAYLPQLYEYIVIQARVLTDGSTAYKVWAKPNFPIRMEFYFFNITNHKEYLEYNAKPILDEVGPYVYSQKWLKYNITFHENGTVTYRQNKTYFFEPELSLGLDTDVIYTINLPMLTSAMLFKNAGPVLKTILTTVFAVTHESFVMNVTVKELLFDGYEDPLLKVSKQIMPNSPYPYSRFAFFYMRNGTDEGLFTVYTGETNSSLNNIVDRWNGLAEIDTWPGPKCNKIEGTTGEMFPPQIDLTKPLQIFVPDMCRTFRMEYTGPIYHYGIKGARFEAKARIFQNSSENPDNECFCPGNCLPSGAVNMSACKWGAPAALSMPHFLYGDPRYLNQVYGLKPNESLHSFYVDVEPVTGLPLDANVRAQVNGILEKIPGIAQFERLNNTVFPLFWFSQTIELTPDLIHLLKLVSTSLYQYGTIACYVIMVAGGLGIFSGIVYYLYLRKRTKEIKM